MPSINVKLCETCLQQLIVKNPYVDSNGHVVPFKGIKLRKVVPEFCDHRAGGKCRTENILLTAMRCANCDKTYWLVVPKDKKCVCPSCRSAHMIPMKEGELIGSEA